MPSGTAIVTLLIGEDYVRAWEAYFASSWRKYADRCDYDIVVLKEYIDQSPRGRERTPHWQKCLIAEAPETDGYDRLIWVDGDIAINHFSAPPIDAECRRDRIGADLSAEWTPFAEHYRQMGFDPVIDQGLNTGVLVLDPGAHGPALREVYDRYDEDLATDAAGTGVSLFENVPLSYHLCREKLVDAIDPRFNILFPYELIRRFPFLMDKGVDVAEGEVAGYVAEIFHASYFLHFVGIGPYRRFLDWLDTDRPPEK